MQRLFSAAAEDIARLLWVPCRATAGYHATALVSNAKALAQAHPQRFYDTVKIEHAAHLGGYNLVLAQRPLKTPAQNLMTLPTYPLALAVAAEWEWLERGKPILHAMPLTSLVATAIDEPKERSKVIGGLLKYVHTDGACVRYEPGRLALRQARVFDPLLAWARENLGWDLRSSDSICGVTQDDATVAAVLSYLEGLDRWQLAAVEQLTSAAKSLVVAAALAHGRIGVGEAIKAARLEEDYQLEDWGMVEAGHDLDIADTNTRVAAPALLLQLLGSAPAPRLLPPRVQSAEQEHRQQQPGPG